MSITNVYSGKISTNPGMEMEEISARITNHSYLLYQSEDRNNSINGNANTGSKTDPYAAIEEYLNLSHRDISKIYQFLSEGSREDLDEFAGMINRLIKKGIVGYEFLEINERPHKSFLSTNFVKPFSRARFYRGSITHSSPILA